MVFDGGGHADDNDYEWMRNMIAIRFDGVRLWCMILI